MPSADSQIEEPFTLPPVEPSLPEEMRRCSTCCAIFPATEFYPRKGQCRRCIATKAHEAYLRRRDVAMDQLGSVFNLAECQWRDC